MGGGDRRVVTQVSPPPPPPPSFRLPFIPASLPSFRLVLSPLVPPSHPALFDADSPMDWEHVDLVLLPSLIPTLPPCPICFDHPHAAQITRCGHHYCAPCVLRYLEEEGCVRRCPMCLEHIHQSDLRPLEAWSPSLPASSPPLSASPSPPSSSAESEEAREEEAGREERVKFLLLARTKGSLTPRVVEGGGGGGGGGGNRVRGRSSSVGSEEEGGWAPGLAEALEEEEKCSSGKVSFLGTRASSPPSATPLPRLLLPRVGSPEAAFSRLILSSWEQEVATLTREAAELVAAREESVGVEGAEWIPFIDEALKMLDRRREKYAARRPRGQGLVEGPPESRAGMGREDAAGRGGGGKGGKGGGPVGGSGPAQASTPRPSQRPRGHSEGTGGSGGGKEGGGRGRGGGGEPGEGGFSAACAADGFPFPMDDVPSAREDKACPSSPPASLGPSSLSGEGLDSQASHFYQLEDGQLAFLHPLTMRCLMAEAGGRHALLPRVVEGTVLEAETLVLTPELRGEGNGWGRGRSGVRLCAHGPKGPVWMVGGFPARRGATYAGETFTVHSEAHCVVHSHARRLVLLLSPPPTGRYGFLKHLPLYSSVKLVELALPPALLSPPTLELFKPEMKKRAQRRKQRERAEEREAARRAREVEREAVREAGRGSSLTEEEIRRIQAQREKGVDLNGPQPWEAARMVSGGDRREEAGDGEDGGKEGEKEGGGLSGSPSEERRALTSSFAEVIRKKGGAATTVLREEMVPALGGGGGGSPAPMSSSPPGRKSDPPPLSGAVPANGGTGGTSGTGGSGGRDCSSSPSLRASAPSMGRVREPESGGEGGRGVWTGRTPFSVTLGTSSSLPERSETGGMWQAGQASPGASVSPTASDGKEPPRPGKQPLQPHQQQKKKGKGGGKGIPIFSTGSQRSYG
jgi:hypothetical protein